MSPQAHNSPAPAPTRIVIVDDHPMVRERLAQVINQEPDLRVCGEAEGRHEALQIVAAAQPHLVIVDLTLKNSHGLDLIKDLREFHPKVLSLVVSMQEEGLYAERAIRAGAHGYITKREATRNILQAIRQVLAGDYYLSENLKSQVISKFVGRPPTRLVPSIESLADRELQVFELIGRGFTTRQIAEQLHLDVKTIETYRARIKVKLGLKDAPELLRKAISWIVSRGS